MNGELASDLARLVMAVCVIFLGHHLLRWLERRPVDASSSKLEKIVLGPSLEMDRMWFLTPALLMSFLCLVTWWRTPTLVDLFLILAMPGAALVFAAELGSRTGCFNPHPGALLFGNVMAVGASIGFLVFCDNFENGPAWGLYLDPSTPRETALPVALILASGCLGFVLPGVLLRIYERRSAS